jgi:hypothetical protein
MSSPFLKFSENNFASPLRHGLEGAFLFLSTAKEAHLYQFFIFPKVGTFEPAFHARMKERKRERKKQRKRERVI